MIQTLVGPNHRFLQQILSFLPLGAMIIDMRGRILYFNLMAVQLTGYSKAEIIEKGCHQLNIKDCQFPCSFLAPEGNHNPRLMRGSITHKQGHTISVLRGIYPLKNDHGKIIGMLETIQDIHWNKTETQCLPECLNIIGLEQSRERHLRHLVEQSKNKLLGIFDEIIDGLFMIDHEYRINAINKTQASYLNAVPKALIKSYCYQAIANRSDPCPNCRVDQVFREGTTKEDLNIRCNKDIRCSAVHRNNLSYVNIHYIPIKTGLGQVHDVLVYIQDISKIKELEEGVRRTENMASLGILASGVAHEINNPLQVILSGANCLLKKSEDHHIVSEVAEQIKECAEKMAAIIRDLSLYSRGIRERNPGTLIHVTQILDDSVVMVSHIRNIEKISITRDYRQTGLIIGDPSQFQQIFVNLIINAFDAIEGKGTISLRTFQQDGFVIIQIQDTGCGIRDCDLPYIFDPFFTTKDPGKGTGLGLNVVYRLVSQHKGSIQVDTKKGEGTRFTLKFPKMESKEVENIRGR